MGTTRPGPLLLLLLLSDILQIYVQSERFNTNDAYPILSVRQEGRHYLMSCTIKYPQVDSDVFFYCPTLDVGTNCYQSCKPVQPCSPPSDRNAKDCVPHGQTVSCRKYEFTNESVIVNLKIDARDERLHGRWHCTHAGKDSVVYEVTPQNFHNDPLEERNDPPDEVVTVSAIKSEHVPTFRQPAVIFTVLAVLGLSLLINMAFCIRCVMMRSYIDSHNAGDSAKCLASTLCLPNELRKPRFHQKEPMLPRLAAWGSLPPPDHVGYNGSCQGSVQMMHHVNSQPVFIHPQAYAPAGSTTSAYRSQTGSQPRIYGQPFQNELLYNPVMENLEAVSLSQPLIYGNGGALSGMQFTNGIPSFIRNPSIKMPSPNPSQRFYFMNNPSPPLLRIPTGSEGQPTYVVQHQQQRPTVVGGHVVYDDVTAAAVNQLNGGDSVQNGVSLSGSPASQTTARGFIPLTKPYSHQSDNNQSTAQSFPSSGSRPVPPQAINGNTFADPNIISAENSVVEHVGTIKRVNNLV